MGHHSFYSTLAPYSRQCATSPYPANSELPISPADILTASADTTLRSSYHMAQALSSIADCYPAWLTSAWSILARDPKKMAGLLLTADSHLMPSLETFLTTDEAPIADILDFASQMDTDGTILAPLLSIDAIKHVSNKHITTMNRAAVDYLSTLKATSATYPRNETVVITDPAGIVDHTSCVGLGDTIDNDLIGAMISGGLLVTYRGDVCTIERRKLPMNTSISVSNGLTDKQVRITDRENQIAHFINTLTSSTRNDILRTHSGADVAVTIHAASVVEHPTCAEASSLIHNPGYSCESSPHPESCDRFRDVLAFTHAAEYIFMGSSPDGTQRPLCETPFVTQSFLFDLPIGLPLSSIADTILYGGLDTLSQSMPSCRILLQRDDDAKPGFITQRYSILCPIGEGH